MNGKQLAVGMVFGMHENMSVGIHSCVVLVTGLICLSLMYALQRQIGKKITLAFHGAAAGRL